MPSCKIVAVFFISLILSGCMFFAPRTEDITFISAKPVNVEKIPNIHKGSNKKLLEISFASNQNLVELNDKGTAYPFVNLCGRTEDASHKTGREIFAYFFWEDLEIIGWDSHRTVNSKHYKELSSKFKNPPFIYRVYIPIKQAGKDSGDMSESGYRFLPSYDLGMYPEKICLQIRMGMYIATSESNLVTIDKNTVHKALADLKFDEY